MRRLFLAPLLLAVWAAPVPAEGQLPVRVLNDIKAATTFIKVRRGPVQASGSGFLLKADAKVALVVTNDHVVSPPRPNPPAPVIEVVFRSGGKEEQVVRAELVATDPDRDLAILRVRDLKDPPPALDLTQKVELIETMPVYIFGFPFGAALSFDKGNPAISVARGTVSSIRRGDHGRLKYVQIDGDMNPGNSGGPVVDAEGRLVGVAVAHFPGTQISMAIPPAELAQMLDGRLAGVSLRPEKIADGAAEIYVELRFIDPLDRVEKASLRVAPTAAVREPLTADADGNWPPLPGAEVFDLKVESQKATGTITLKSGLKSPVSFTIQPVYSNGRKAVVHVQPGKPYTVDFGRVTAGDVPAASPGGVKLTDVPQPSVVGDLKVKALTVGSGQGPACLFWSDDGKAFYHLDGKGTVRRIGVPDLQEEAVRETGKQCGWLSPSAEGLVLTVTEAQELWLLDPKTLKVGTRVAIAGAQRVVSAPKLPVAYAVESNFSSGTLNVIDLKAGRVVKQYGDDEFGKNRVGLENPVVSLDGRFLFCIGVLGELLRFRLNGTEVRFEEASPGIMQGLCAGIWVSADGEYVCAPSGGGNGGLQGQPPAAYATYVFSTTSFRKPVALLKQGGYPTAVGFDLRSGLFYAQNFEYNLILFDARGIKLKQFKLSANGGGSGGARQFLVRPEGRKLVVLGQDLSRETSPLWYVELPEK